MMTLRTAVGRIAPLSIAILLAGGCAPGDDAGNADEIAIEPPAAEMTPTAARPDTTAEGIWAYLQEVDYQNNWRLWPGKDRLYAGVEPHGMLLTTYVNDLAYDALTNGTTRMPEGAVIVKENYMPDSTFAAVTTMFKVGGYNPDHQDWYFAKHDPAGVVDVHGRAPMCQACHNAAPGNDYLYTELP